MIINLLHRFFSKNRILGYHLFPSSVVKSKPEVMSSYNKLLMKQHYEQVKIVEKVYTLMDVIELSNSKVKLKPKSERKCRFCGKSSPEVSFKNDAHLIPEQLENRTLLSDFECNNCNSRFGKMENELANFLGPFRSLTKMVGKSGVKNFKSKNGSVYIDSKTKDQVYVKAQEITKRTVKEGEIYSIQTLGYPFRPINVYRCLLKIALSLIDEKEIESFKKAIDFLQDDNYKRNPDFDTLFSVHQYFIPGKIEELSRIYIYKLREELNKLNYPTYTFVFYFKNLILQIYIPFFEHDLSKASRIKNLLIFPPLIRESWQKKYGMPQPFLHSLNDEKLISEPKQVFEIKLTNQKSSGVAFSKM